MMKEKYYGVIVVGGGHAGVEASLASARMGVQTLIITIDNDSIGWMPCNPAIGGPGKSQVVREIDALGGAMAMTTDETLTQIKMLNTSRGPAVWSLRAQVDKWAYSRKMKERLENQPNLHLRQGLVEKLIIEGNRIKGVQVADGSVFYADAVVLTTGTYLSGRIYISSWSMEAGRWIKPPSNALSNQLKELGFRMSRFNTGTTPRVDKRSIDLSKFQEEVGDFVPLHFSFWNKPKVYDNQIPSYLGWTNEKTIEVTRKYMHLSPSVAGLMVKTGPRTCPSMEEKVRWFPDKTRHQFFLEPEGFGTNEMYMQGMYMSMPYDMQLEVLRTIPGLENVEIIRPAYVIDYDYIIPTQLNLTYETKLIEGLFIAGQPNGTTGYDEAAGQGLLAGINAALKVQGKAPFILRRNEAYLGVMTDDLLTKELFEPYRITPSHCEYRQILRQDNADLRLTRKGYEIGVVEEWKFRMFEEKERKLEEIKKILEQTTIYPNKENVEKLKELEVKEINQPLTLFDLLKRQDFTKDTLKKLDSRFVDFDDEILMEIEIEAKYAGYIQREMNKAKEFLRFESFEIPDDIDYNLVPSLSKEARTRLSEIKPKSIGQAMRITGVRPSDIQMLIMYLKERKGDENV
ncbi:MAG: tRNA uridine-5-carboxymethylaminomethyl(34) synthesis enzyme MnmG [Caldisericum exile]|uniref:tRNA uridine-5-carboxymethylaminomethyl(34) synthesis enzyme MnmG n=1 Tax=Caldisericum TaxID=693074 RepID=UPI0039FD83F7